MIMKGYTNLPAYREPTDSLATNSEKTVSTSEPGGRKGWDPLVKIIPETVEYPVHSISPAILDKLPTEPVQIQMPKADTAAPKMNWWTVFAAPVGMILVMLIMFFATESMSVVHYLMMLPMSLVGVVGAIFTYRGQKKDIRKAAEENKKKYRTYLNTVKGNLEQISLVQQKTENKDNPPAKQCAAMKQNSDGLWNRVPGTAKFMSVRIGSGMAPLCVQIKTPERKYDTENELEEEARQIVQDYADVPNIPKLIDFKENPSVGIVGDRDSVVKQALSLVVNATAKHSYEDLKIVVVYPEEESDIWGELRWLPHVYDIKREQRYIASTRKSDAKVLLNNLTQIIEKRTEGIGRVQWNQKFEQPHYLIIVADISCIRGHKITEALTMNISAMSVSTVFLADRIQQLPVRCKSVIEVMNNTGVFYETAAYNLRTEFVPDRIDRAPFEKYCRTMAPIRIDGARTSSEIPSRYTFFEAWGVDGPQNLPIAKYWSEAIPSESMEVPLGIGAEGNVFCFDIHQHVHGVNGMYVGMAGSGKTSMVRSWILSMAVQFSPRYVNFALIDFKGTSLLSGLEKLPHVVGTISNLDQDIRRNLTALESEIQRREAKLKAHGGSIYTSYDNGDRSLPFLYIVIDELNEFKSWAMKADADGMKLLNRLAQVGRALGMHLIAGSQTTTPFTDIIEGNSKFYWCLKTSDTSDSRRMLKTDDAYHITNKGRAIVRVGANEEYEEIQPAYADGAYLTPEELADIPEREIALVSLQGVRSTMEINLPASKKTELESVVAHIRCISESQKIPQPRKVWPDRLPNRLYLNELEQPAYGTLCVAVGRVDDPKGQCQYPLHIDINKHIVLYGTPKIEKGSVDHLTDTAMFIQTAALSLLSHCSPEQVEVYLLGKALQMFRDCPQVQKSAETFAANPLVDAVHREVLRRKVQGLSPEDKPIVCFIDGIGEVIRDYKEEMKNIAQYGVSCNCFLFASAGGVNEVSSIFGYLTGGYALWFSSSKSDYETALATKPIVKIPEKEIFGRGILFDGYAMEFQTARVGCSVDEINAAVQKLQDAYPNHQKTAPKTARQDGEVYIGVSRKSNCELTHDFGKSSKLLVLGPQSSKRDALLLNITEQLAGQKDIYQMVGVDLEPEAYAAVPNIQFLSSGKELDDYLEKMRPELVERSNQLLQDPQAQFSKYVLIIEDWDQCLQNISEISKQRMEKNIMFHGENWGIHTVASCSYEAAAKRFTEDQNDATRLLTDGTTVLLDYAGQTLCPAFENPMRQYADEAGDFCAKRNTAEPIAVIKGE